MTGPLTSPARGAVSRRLLRLALTVILLSYAGGAVWLMTQETRLVFRAGSELGPARPSSPLEQVDIPRADGLRQFAWVMKHPTEATNRPWVLYLHGNAASIASRSNIAKYEMLRGLGLNVLAPEYRGFGGLDGVPTEAGVYRDARAAYDHLRNGLDIPADRIAVYGWSLGGAVAVDLAANVPEAAVILEGAPASLVEIGQREYPLFPIRLLIRNPFNAVQKVGRITAPMLFLHSAEDTVVPVTEGRRLFDAATARKAFVEVRGGHIDAARVDAAVFLDAIGRLLGSAGLVDRSTSLPSPSQAIKSGS